MSTPLFNSVVTTLLNTSGLGNTGSLIAGVKWGSGGYGFGVNLDISFPDFTSLFINPYGVQNEISAFSSLTPAERDGVRSALGEWSAVANVNFFEVADGAFVGDLRFAGTTAGSSNENGHAYYPANDPTAGDVWFRYDSWHAQDHFAAVVPGTYDHLTMLHEIGHALGLQHPFEGSPAMPPEFDSYSFTIMSYSASTGQPGNVGAYFYPTTPMYYDLAAIQLIYGARPHNEGNTTYTFFGGQNYWQTIDDSGGIDTIVYLGSDGCTIDLEIGRWSDLGLSIEFYVAPDQSDTVMIGPRSVIENATGGNGNDFLFGNSLGNRLSGSGGGDSIFGYGGNDLVNGGLGRDVLRGGTGKDAFAFNKAINAIDSIRDFSVVDDTINLAKSVFTAIGRTLTRSEFVIGGQASNAQQHIVYNANTGALLFDRDGAGGDPALQFATLGRFLPLTAADFIMI